MKRMIFPVIKKYKKLLISVMLVSAMGCGFMSGLSSAHESLKISLDDYVDEYNYPDAVITTDVTNRHTIDKLKELDQVSEVDARLCGDTYLKGPEGRYLSVRVFTYSPEDKMKFHYWSQDSSDSMDEILLEYNFAEDNHIKAGDTVKVKVDKEYREYFVAGIVTSPETLSVQPTEDSWGANNDFGYAYAPTELLTKEYEKKYNETKDELDSKKKELDDGWKKGQEELSDTQSQLEDARQQLEDGKKLFEDSSIEAQEKLLQLDEAEAELLSTKNELVSKRAELLNTKNSIEQTAALLSNNTDKLKEASDGIKKIDEALITIDSIAALTADPHVEMFINMMNDHPDTELSYLVQMTDTLQSFMKTLSSYGFSYDVTEQVTAVSERLIDYMDQLISDCMYVHRFDDTSSISRSEKLRLIVIMRRYHLYNILISFDENLENTKYVLDNLTETIDEKNLVQVVSFLPEIGSSDSVEELLNGISEMTDFVDVLSDYTGQTITTTGDLADLYLSSMGSDGSRKKELTEQKNSIIASLAEYGVTEEDLSDVDSFITAKQKEINDGIEQIDDGIAQIDEAMPEINDGLQQIADGRDEIRSKTEEAEQQIADAEKELDENEDLYMNESARALSEFMNLKNELKEAYKKLDEGEGYDMFCNQFLVYFKDGTDSEACLQKLKDILGDEEIAVKSNYTYENSAVRKRINDNLQTIETLSILTPAIFFAIILIVVFLFMSLIIKQSRREIGILRALGFTKGNIRALYCGVNFAASLVSIVLGTILGIALMCYVGVYFKDFFPIPEFKYRPNMVMYVLSVVLTIAAGLVSTMISTGSISKIMPSEAMSRPAPETADVPKLLEKLTAKSSPMTKFSVTTLIRNKMRFVFSVICIASSVMMIFSSLAFITSKNQMLYELYEERIRYDCQIFFKNDPDDELIKELNDLGFVSDAQRLPFYQSEIEYGGHKEKTVINAADRDTELVGIYASGGEKLSIPENGLIMERHLAQKLGAAKGDTVTINGTEMKIASISDQSISRFQYVSYETGEKLGDPTIGSVICNISEEDEQKLIAFLTEKDDYLYSVFTRLALQANEKTFKTYDLAAWIIIGFAIIIGLIIVINTAQTNLLEKKRELCVLRTLGFQHSEVSRKWFVQSFLQFIFSCAVGLPAGIFIAMFALQKLGNDTREYVFANSLAEYIFTILLVLGYVIVSHFIAMHSMKKWDLVESVKDKE